jgi:branched-chain amino acid transport system substrate-binding protein
MAATPKAMAEIRIGVAGPMTGSNAAFGTYMKNGVAAALADINARGGVNGEQLSMIVEDDQCDVNRATDVANRFAAQDVRFVVGHFCSNASAAAAVVYAERDVLMITPSATLPALTDAGFSTTLRLAPRDDTQGALAAQRIEQDHGQAKVAFVEDGSSSARALLAAFTRLRPPDVTVAIKPGDRNIGNAAAELARQQFAAIYCACTGADAGSFLAYYAQAGGSAGFYGPDLLLFDAFTERAGSSAEGAQATFSFDPQASPNAREVISSLRAKELSADGATLQSYAAVEIYVSVVKEDPASAAVALAARLKAGMPIKTILGTVIFDTKGDIVPPPYDWYRWSRGGFTKTTQTNQDN